MKGQLENPNPLFKSEKFAFINQELREQQENDENVEDPVDEQEIFELIRDIKDPEYDYTLEELSIVTPEQVQISQNIIIVYYTPTVETCSKASLIGLMIIQKLKRSINKKFKLSILIKPGTHVLEKDINKQINDKERTMAANETPELRRIINTGIFQVKLQEILKKMQGNQEK